MRRIKFARNLPVWEKRTSHPCKYEVFAQALSYWTLNEITSEGTSIQHAEPLSAHFKRIEPKVNVGMDIRPVEDIQRFRLNYCY